MKGSRILIVLTLLAEPLLAQRGRGFNPGFRVDPVI
jgi:hypothetical protein